MSKSGIVCTIGPASQSGEVLERMVCGGMTICRLNFSHGAHSDHFQSFKNIKAVAGRLNKNLPIMADLQGPKIRISGLNAALPASTGQILVIGQDFSLDCEISQLVKPGQAIFIEDGLLQLRVIKILDKNIYCSVINSGLIKPRKGVNMPGVNFTPSVITDKDALDLKFALDLGVDLVAMSFVRSAEDVKEFKKFINGCGPKVFPKLVSKIEKAEALENIDAIIAESDMIMVARGDLGVEIPSASVPLAQKDIVKKCNRANKPVIVATHMLHSMIENPRPTRAETSDVANAVLDGADFLMLSGETAHGNFPAKAVGEMSMIIETASIKIDPPVSRSRPQRTA